MLLIRKRISKEKNSQNMAISIFRVAGELEEIDILQFGRGGVEARAGQGRCENADFMLSACQVRADHLEFGFQAAKLVVGSNNAGPNLSLQGGQGFRWHAFQHNLS